MKILCLGDFHLTDKQPSNRRDDYWETVKLKLEFVLQTAAQKDVSVLIAPGDFTDSPSLSYSTFSVIVDMLKEYLNKDRVLLSTFGQHDMKFRTQKNTALSALESALYPYVKIIDQNEEVCIDSILFYGASYGEQINDYDSKKFKVLIVHKMIIGEKLLWKGQEGYETAAVFIRRHPYDLIVSGDNHQPFIVESKGGRVLVNCGAMLRNSIDLIDHKPFIVLFDTSTKKYEKIYLPIIPGEEVFKIDIIEKEKERNENLETFISGLSGDKEMGLAFEDNLHRYIKNNEIEPAISDIILDAMRKEK